MEKYCDCLRRLGIQKFKQQKAVISQKETVGEWSTQDDSNPPLQLVFLAINTLARKKKYMQANSTYSNYE